MMDIDSISDAPWTRGNWDGELLSIDGCRTDDFVREDVERLIAYGETPDDWDGASAGIALLRDGRYIAWESSWGPTGCGFSCDAYGGDADIAFAHTVEAALEHISEGGRELLEWAQSAE